MRTFRHRIKVRSILLSTLYYQRVPRYIFNTSFALLQIVLETYSNLDARDSSGATLLDRCVSAKRIDMVHYILSIGVSVNSHDGYPLRYAVSRRYYGIVRILVYFGADVNMLPDPPNPLNPPNPPYLMMTAFEMALFFYNHDNANLCAYLLLHNGLPPRTQVPLASDLMENYEKTLTKVAQNPGITLLV